MINLLPPQEKEFLKTEIKKRKIFIVWFLFFFFFLCFSLTLLSIDFYIKGEIEYQNTVMMEIENKEQGVLIKEIIKNTDFFNKIIEKLDSFYLKKTYFSEILEKTAKFLPKDSYLNNISFAVKQDKKSTNIEVAVSGFIASRESLFEFKKLLEKENGMQDIYFPPSNWTKPNNIEFFINFKIPE